MTQYRMKMTLDIEALDDVEARSQVRALLQDISTKVLKERGIALEPVKVSCVQSGDHSGRSVLRPTDLEILK